MVIFVKGSELVDAKRLHSIMTNIEKNKNVYNMDGSLNKTKNNKKSFNKYIYNQIEFDATVSCGFLIIYNLHLNVDDLIDELTYHFDKDLNEDDSYYPVSSNNYKSTQHTMILNKTNRVGTSSQLKMKPSPYRILCKNSKLISGYIGSGARFVWYIHHVKKNNEYIQIQELCSRMPTKMYLMRSISTIIYDSMNIFNVKPNLKQLDYPSINQLTQNLLPIRIRINYIYGLDREIVSNWMDIPDTSILLTLQNIKYTECKYSKYKTSKVNKNVSWVKQLKKELSKPFNLKKYEQSELPDDICFISRSPLYGAIYIIEINSKIPNDSTDTKCYISVNAYIFHSMFENDYLIRYLSKKDISINKVFVSSYPRTELMVINMIPDDKIHKVKKNIMKCISKNGACVDKSINNNSKIFTYDAEKNIIYLGLPNYIHVITSHEYRKNNTVLFSWQL
jgi:hypothetical protein